MKREDLEHIIRASGDVLGESEVIIVGSQAILGASYEGLPKEVTLSVEVDVMATHDPDGSKALRLNGAIGEMTRIEQLEDIGNVQAVEKGPVSYSKKGRSAEGIPEEQHRRRPGYEEVPVLDMARRRLARWEWITLILVALYVVGIITLAIIFHWNLSDGG